jgi:hypothetical protein
MILALLASSATGGFNFAWQGAAPKLSKINPLNGLKRMFGLNALVELTKALLKFTLVAGALSLVISEQIETEQQAEVVRSLGIPYGQGYLFSRPTPKPDYIPTVRPPFYTEEKVQGNT